MAFDLSKIEQIADQLAQQNARQIIKQAIAEYDNIAISFSGAEDVLLIYWAVQFKANIQVFTLDTGRLHPQTLQYLEDVKKHFNIELEIMSPHHETLQAFTKEKGLFSFYEDGHKQCCGIRKIAPLRRKLATVDAWITGQRKDQSPSTRSQVNVLELDPAFSSPEKPLIKFNPMANMSSDEVWFTIRGNEIPFNPLHQQGFTSIGCQPCTRPILPSQHEREGRWWWEEDTIKECGLHSGNSISSSQLD